jgi:hypothetical protein
VGSGFEPQAPYLRKRYLSILFRGTSHSFHETRSIRLQVRPQITQSDRLPWATRNRSIICESVVDRSRSVKRSDRPDLCVFSGSSGVNLAYAIVAVFRSWPGAMPPASAWFVLPRMHDLFHRAPPVVKPAVSARPTAVPVHCAADRGASPLTCRRAAESAAWDARNADCRVLPGSI